MASKYKEIREKAFRDPFGELPVFFAFNQKQFEEGLEELDCDLKDLCSIGHGGFMLKSHRPLLDTIGDNLKKQLSDYLSTDDGLREAIIYEMGNHEFHYGGHPDDVIDAIGVDWDDRVIRIFEEAKVIFYDSVEW